MTLNEEQIKELDNFIAEMPLKYGLPLLQFFNKIHDEQKVSEEISVEELSAPEIISKIKKEQQ
jgi:hypothetical protein